MLFDFNKKELKRIKKIADKVIQRAPMYEKMSDSKLQSRTIALKKALEEGYTLDDILVDAFAICREASYRVLGKKHFLVQVMGGIAIHQGRVTEMKTGEGKTLTELLPAYLNALTGKGVHVITVNSYLAKRDMEEMKPLFNYLGISVGLVAEGLSPDDKRKAYNCDVTYTTNQELGFDYLRDNMVKTLEEKVQRDLNYVIIDEIDSVLIDEARTPLIISGPGPDPSHLVSLVSKFVKRLKETDYDKDEKEKKISLTDKGIAKLEAMFYIDNIASLEHSELNHYVSQALYAEYLMTVDKDYIVSNGEILIVDGNTGRIADGRRYSNGLHQAIEAKEMVTIKPESETVATITYQNFFRMYKKVSGMSGTVKTEEEEFKEIYGLDVVVIPTNKPVKRIDRKDLIFSTKKAKYKWFLRDVIDTHSTGRPILISTPSIEISEEVSQLLSYNNLSHKVLNAKNHEQEAEIVRLAGAPYSITVATSMAGRGTDIKLSAEVKQLGGLKVIGIERAESRRIDNQLIGRAGRQGDPGESQFYISYDDRLLEIYLPESTRNKLKSLDFKERPIDIKFAYKQVNKAQRCISALNFDIRKNTIKYDDVVSRQREVIYAERDKILKETDITKHLFDMINSSAENLISNYCNENLDKLDYEDLSSTERVEFIDGLCDEICRVYSLKNKSELAKFLHSKCRDEDSLVEYLINILKNTIIPKVEYGRDSYNIFLKDMMLSILDECWIYHINRMESLKKEVLNQSYNQKDPAQIYQLESSKEFNCIGNEIIKKFVTVAFNVPIEKVLNNAVG